MASAIAASHSTTQTARIAQRRSESDVTQTVGEVAFTLPTQPGNAMGRYAGQSTMIDIQGTQKFEPVEQTVSSSRVVTNLEVRSQMKRLILPASISLRSLSR
ncbi:hypothetical protein [Klebsiella pneumoniae]|uniref:hypothetical protein n=1 Tax=Klebsiella pneumoniae TaxID=573 RepID=UPI002265B871|nr:hypothetical protein [Klebsiella pneumoniae]